MIGTPRGRQASWRWVMLVLGAVMMASPTPVEAQFFGLFKKKKKQPPAPTALDSMRAQLDSLKKGQAQQPAPVTPPAGVAGANPAATTQSTTAQQPALSPEDQRNKEQWVQEAKSAELTKDSTRASAQLRMDLYQKILFIDPADPRASLGYASARQDLQQAAQTEIRTGQETKAARDERNRKVGEASSLLDQGEWRKARSIISTVLQEDPTSPGAKEVEDRIPAVKRKQELKRLLLWLLPVILALVALLVLGVRWLVKVKEGRDRKRQDLMDKRAAVIKVIDGIGRGKLVAIDKEKQIFRIGAASGSSEEEKNELVLSDSAAAISRFHCAIIRKNGVYFIIDSSLNGTLLNGDRLERGEHHALEDGDELTLADVTRIKFLHT